MIKYENPLPPWHTLTGLQLLLKFLKLYYSIEGVLQHRIVQNAISMPNASKPGSRKTHLQLDYFNTLRLFSLKEEMGKGWAWQIVRKWFISNALFLSSSASSCWAAMEGGSCLKLGKSKKNQSKSNKENCLVSMISK